MTKILNPCRVNPEAVCDHVLCEPQYANPPATQATGDLVWPNPGGRQDFGDGDPRLRSRPRLRPDGTIRPGDRVRVRNADGGFIRTAYARRHDDYAEYEVSEVHPTLGVRCGRQWYAPEDVVRIGQVESGVDRDVERARTERAVAQLDALIKVYQAWGGEPR